MAKITLNPVTRISGLLSIEVLLEKNRIVEEAFCRGEQFRGFELMLKGRDIFDAVYLSERVCGICSMAHGFTAANLIRQIYQIKLSREARILEQLMLGAEFLQNHIRHFYLLALPDYMDCQFFTSNPPSQEPSRFSISEQQQLLEHYYAAIDYSAKCHEMQAIFGGKAPHQHGLTAAGITVIPTADHRLQFIALLESVQEFIQEEMLPDAYRLAAIYPDYFEIGTRPARFISFGLFDPSYGGSFLSGVYDNSSILTLKNNQIDENITYAWFKELDSIQQPDPEKPGAYSWVKAPRYKSLAFEGGPLARKIISAGLQKTTDKAPLTGTMARLVARAEEASLIASWMNKWIHSLPEHGEYIKEFNKPVFQHATQMNDAPRGPLLHSMSVQDNQIASYNIITPSTWNFSPKDEYGQSGPVEEALVGTTINDPGNPVEIGRIIRSFDPCLSCGTHHISIKKES